MPSRLKMLLLIGGLIFAGGLIAYFQLREPTFEGKDLRDWVWTERHASSPDQKERARVGIRALCTNNLPELVKSMNYDSATELDRIRSRMRWLPRAAQDFAISKHLVGWKGVESSVAGAALVALGPEAKPAIPGLTKLLYVTNIFIATHTAVTLAGLGTNSLPSLLQVVADPQCPSRSVAIACIGLTKIGTNVAPAIPIHIECTDDKDHQVATEALRVLRLLATETCVEVPASVLTPPASARTAGVPVPGLPNY